MGSLLSLFPSVMAFVAGNLPSYLSGSRDTVGLIIMIAAVVVVVVVVVVVAVVVVVLGGFIEVPDSTYTLIPRLPDGKI